MLCKQKVQLSCAEITMILINDIYQNWVSFFHPSNLKLQRHACVPKWQLFYVKIYFMSMKATMGIKTFKNEI